MPAQISYDPTANVYVIEAEDGEMFLGVGTTHAKAILLSKLFALSEPQAREAVLQAFARLGAPFSLDTIKRIATQADASDNRA